MNETEHYLIEQLKIHIFSGLSNDQALSELVDELKDDRVNQDKIQTFIRTCIQEKLASEQDWPEKTQTDKVYDLFDDLGQRGIVAIPNAGWDKGEAFQTCVDSFRSKSNPEEWFGIAYFTSQDIEGAINDGKLYIGYSSSNAENEEANALKTANVITEMLDREGFHYEWSGTTSDRILLTLPWQLRGPWMTDSALLKKWWQFWK